MTSVNKIEELTARLIEPNEGLNARDWLELKGRIADLYRFLVAARNRLPTQVAVERDRKRKR